MHTIPLSNIKENTIVDVLLFRDSGNSETIKMDCIPQMTSDLMKAMGAKLGIQERFSLPYHHENQGKIERFNRTLENMLKSFVEDHASNWDKFIPYLSFAMNETSNRDTHISSVELA